jgi:hypothetical protein
MRPALGSHARSRPIAAKLPPFRGKLTLFSALTILKAALQDDPGAPLLAPLDTDVAQILLLCAQSSIGN